jgi:protein-S-isoprenylcysteine O-methyltransferase Ste14
MEIGRMTAKGTAVRRSIASALFVAAWPALMFVLAGDLRWVQGWLFALWLVGLYLGITIWMHRHDPALLAERRRQATRSREGVASDRADRALVLLIFVIFAGWIAVMPLDARRYHWTSPVTIAEQAAGGALLGLSAFLLFRSVHDNTFLSGVVRVQSDRKQRVVSTGVYAVVRHPMYLGMLVMFVGAPLLLESRLALIAAAAVALILIVRIAREERLLAAQLDGYAEYRRNVRYRLIPFVW